MARLHTSTRQTKSRAGFTLIELLIAVLIIGILATLVTLGVSKAMSYAKQVATKTEMAQIEQALGVAAIEMGRVPYIPSFLILMKKYDQYNLWPTTDPNSNYAKMSQRILAQMFPKWATKDPMTDIYPEASWPVGLKGYAILNASQTYVFFLNGNEGNGFSPTEKDPWAKSAGKRWGPYYQFPANRFETLKDELYPRIKDYWDNPGKHLVVYSQLMVGSTATTLPKDETPSGFPGRQIDANNKYYMPKGYQIFSAGKNGIWGKGYGGTAFNGKIKDQIGSDPDRDLVESDDQANFSESPLGKPIND